MAFIFRNGCKENYRFHDHEKLAHYADAAADIEFKFPFGFKELEGIHSRTDFDLKAHEEHSGKKLQYFDHEENKSYTPLCCRNIYWFRSNVFSSFLKFITKKKR